MRPGHYSLFHALVQELAWSAPGSWFLAHALRSLDRFTLKISGGRATLTSKLAGVPVVWVTTTGAHSGKPRTRPLLPIRDPERPGVCALIASNFGQHRFPAWYYNLKKNPHASCVAGDTNELYLAHEATGDEYDRFWAYATDTYFGYTLYRKRAGRRIPIMVLEKLRSSG